MKGLHICATGRALPRQIVTNEALSRRVDTNDAWIASRTGIRERRFCCGEETAASLAADAARRLGLPLERFYQNMGRYGNTSAASIPIALDEMAQAGLLRAGQKVICAGFGAGLTWGGVLPTF